MSETPEEVLQRMLVELQSDDSETRLAAMRELGTLHYSSAAILQRLECMALWDPSSEARQAALLLLDSSTHCYVRAKLSQLPRSTRSAILTEIDTWQSAGLLAPGQADVLRRRYDFDTRAPAAAPVQQVAPAPAAPAPEAAPARAEPAPTLTQRLVSQSTVNVFLYLGAFLVIGAALILAALVEAARIPILSGVAVAFAASAVLLKKRLPQPSFALFIVFSFLLPILSRVVSESLPFQGTQDSLYWAAVFLLMAAIWAISARFYTSRLFSIVAFASLGLSALNFVRVFTTSGAWAVCGVALSIWAGLAGAVVLRRWKDDRFALPLGISVQAAQLGLLATSIGISLDTLSASSGRLPRPDEWLAFTLTWLLAAGFYLWCTQLYNLILFPWAAAAALLPAAWLLPLAFKAGELGTTAIYAAWALVVAAASEGLHRLGPGRLKLASLPLLWAAVILFISASGAGLIDSALLGFSTLAGSAVACTMLHIARPRKALWFIGLLFGINAYFAFFALPMFKTVEIPARYQWLGIGLLLMLPELFMQAAAGWRSAWRHPLIVLGVICVFGPALAQLSFVDFERRVSLISFSAYAALALAYALHFRRIFLLYFATGFAALALLFAAWPFHTELWLPALTGLAVVYYLGGLALRRFRPQFDGWASALRISGLALGTAVIAAALLVFTKTGAAYAVVVAVLFFAEVYLRSEDRLEPAGPLFLSAAAVLAFWGDRSDQRMWLLLGVSLLWVGRDAVFARTLHRRRAALVTRGIAAALVLGSSVNMLLTPAPHGQVALGFGAYAAVAAFEAWWYRQPLMGYAAACFTPLAVFFALRAAGQDNWLYAIVVVAALYYAAGYVLRRRAMLPRWSAMLLFSGLGLGTLNALSAPLQHGLPTAIPVAIAATLFALEAFARSNVWLGFPANVLYLEAYFLILASLKVDEPQFYSVGAALLGILMHYLLTRAGSKLGAFLTGMFSQLVLLGTTYIQLVSTERLGFFVVIFLEGLVTLGYGIVIRSRSLLITPIIFIVLSVFAVVYGALKGISTVILIGCSGILLLLLGILAVVLRERLAKFGDRWSAWRA